MFYFADICAAPGGFTQYISWRRNLSTTANANNILNSHSFGAFVSKSKGWGLSLRDKNCDWDTSKLPRDFSITYGKDDSGNIMNIENIKHLQTMIMKETNGMG